MSNKTHHSGFILDDTLSSTIAGIVMSKTQTDTSGFIQPYKFTININNQSTSTAQIQGFNISENIMSSASGNTNSTGHSSLAITPTYSAPANTTNLNGINLGVFMGSTFVSPSILTNSNAIALSPLSSQGISTGTITNAKGINIVDASVGSGPNVITNQFGIDIASLTRGSTINAAIRIKAAAGGTNCYGILFPTTTNELSSIVTSITQAKSISLEKQTYQITSGSILTASITAAGSGYTTNDVLTVTTGGSSGTITATSVAAAGQISVIALNSGGTGYLAGDVLTLAGGTSGTVQVNTVDGSGVILTVILLTGGSGYSTGTGVATSGGTGAGATIDISTIYTTGQVLTISITTVGSGYSTGSGKSTTGGTGTGCTINILSITPSSATITTAASLYIEDAPAAGTGVTITNAYALQLASTSGSASGGIQFGTDSATLYRSAANTLKTDGNLATAKLITLYNNIATVSNGVPSEVAKIDTTGLTADVTASTLYAVPATGEGLYRVSAYIVETTAASLTSTLPNVQVVYTDKDSNTSVTLDVTPILAGAGIGQTGALTANTAGTVSSGTVPIYVKASTTIQYQTANYASNIAGMTFAIHLKLEAL